MLPQRFAEPNTVIHVVAIGVVSCLEPVIRACSDFQMVAVHSHYTGPKTASEPVRGDCTVQTGKEKNLATNASPSSFHKTSMFN